MSEERWHNFAKEKPSEDMEGRNFIVSNGHYEKIATWCGYWENEPFMGDHLCDEVVSWKFYFTLEEEKANDATRTEPKAMKCDELKAETIVPQGCIITLQMYPKAEVEAAIAELKNKLDDAQAKIYADSIDAWKRERRLKRALWLARAERNKALGAIVHCQGAWYDTLETKQSAKFWNKGGKLLNASKKCRAKAEEYK